MEVIDFCMYFILSFVLIDSVLKLKLKACCMILQYYEHGVS